MTDHSHQAYHMKSYIYTTHPCEDWLEVMRNEWLHSCRPYFSFSYSRQKSYRPHQFPSDGQPFWMYAYYSEITIKKDCPEYSGLKKAVPYRVRVIDWADSPEFGTKFPCPFAQELQVYVFEPPASSNVVTWFKCDMIQEIFKSPNELLSLTDFEVDTSTSRNVGLALNASIPVAKCLSPMFVMQTASYQIQD